MPLALLAVLVTSCSTPEQARPSESPGSSARTSPPTGPVLSKLSITAKFGEQGIRVSPNGEMILVVEREGFTHTIYDLAGRSLATLKLGEIGMNPFWLPDSSGVVIGKKGEDIEKLRGEVSKLLKMPLHDVRLNISEIRKPELDAFLVAEGIAQQLERRVQFRRAMRRAVTNTMRIGAEGIKVRVSGRLNGAEIARSEQYREGRVPLHTLRADIDYGLAEARTTYGVIGVKVWVFRGEVREGAAEQTTTAEPSEAPRPQPQPQA